MKQRRFPRALYLSALLVLFGGLSTLTACKTYYKRGGDGGALAADQADCQRRTGEVEGERYQACLRDLGWSTAGPLLEAGSPDVPATHVQSAAKKEKEASRAGDPVLPEPKAITPPETEVQTPKAPGIDEQAADPGQPEPKTTAVPETEVQAPAPQAVGSWFKFGGNPEQLQRDQAACLAESRRSEQSLSWQADPDFLACMKTRGWHALAE